MLNKLLLLLLTFAPVAKADLIQEVQRCYSQTADDRSASYCAASILARNLDQLKDRDGDRRPGRPDNDGFSTLYACDGQSDPRLHRLVYDIKGQLLRDDILKTFTEGDDDQEILACRDEMLNSGSRIADEIRAVCSCTNDGDPSLIVDLVDQRYQTLAKVTLAVYRAGDDAKERSDCSADRGYLAICRDR